MTSAFPWLTLLIVVPLAGAAALCLVKETSVRMVALGITLAGLMFSIGAVIEAYRSGGHAAEAQLNAGWKYRTIPPAANQTAEWSRIPVEALVMYRAPAGLRLGGGVAMHLANTLEASGDVVNDKVTFKSEPGFVVQAEYSFRRMSFDLRYTLMTYKVETGGTGDVDASSFGGGLSYWFGGAGRK